MKSREVGFNERCNVEVAAKIGSQNVQFPESTSRGLTDTRFLNNGKRHLPKPDNHHT